MSSISYIYSTQSAAISNYKGEELSTSTKLRLEALGIDPSYVSTESQAQILIAQAEAAPKQNSTGNQQQGGGNSSREQLVSEARDFAQNVGAKYNDQDSLEKLLEKISNKLYIMAKDPSKYEQVQVYQADLKDIAQRAEVLVNRQQNIFNELDMISINNRILLGL